jgi:hypothetical protein
MVIEQQSGGFRRPSSSFSREFLRTTHITLTGKIRLRPIEKWCLTPFPTVGSLAQF